MTISPKLLPFGIMFMTSYGVPGILPAFPVMREYWNLTPEQVSLLLAFFALPGIAMAPLSGVLIDRLPRKLLLMLTMTLYIGGGFLGAVAPTFSVVLLGRFIQGLGQTPMMLIANSLVADMSTGPERAKLMGRLHGTTCIGVISFPLLSGYLAMLNWRLCFLVPALISLPIFLLCWYLPMPKTQASTLPLKTYLRQVGNVIKSPQILLLLAICVLATSVTNGAVMTFYPLYASDRFGALSSNIGLLYSLSLVGMLAGSFGMATLQRHLGTRRMFMLISFASAMGMLAFTHVPAFIFLLFPLILAGLSDGILFPACNLCLANISPASVRAVVLSTNILGFRFSQTLAPLFYSAILGFSGYSALYYTAAASLLTISVLAFFALKEPVPLED